MKYKGTIVLWVLILILLSGCAMHTAEQMYCLPKRSKEYSDLQNAIDKAMTDLEYCAPLTGENQQTVQMADLDGDEAEEYLLFAKGSSERPLRILIFDQHDGRFVHTDTIESNGSSFDLVEYIQMDNKPGLEMVVGRQLSNQVLRSVSVYNFSGGQTEQLLSVNYTRFLTVDMDMDSRTELFVLRPGQTDTANGVAELYRFLNNGLERSNEVNMSGPADQLKRILSGSLHGGEPAVYAASAAGDTALITDVFALVDGRLANVSLSNESGTSVQTLRNYYVYADDIDNDGSVELPSLITMQTLAEEERSSDRHYLIRWFALNADGSEVDKLYTYHNFMDGWYLELQSSWASRLTVQQEGSNYAFYLWSKSYNRAYKVMTISLLTGQDREVHAQSDGRFLLLKTDSVTYAAGLESMAKNYGITQESMVRSFHLIQQDWKTGET